MKNNEIGGQCLIKIQKKCYASMFIIKYALHECYA